MSGIKGILFIFLLGISFPLFCQTPKPPNLVLLDYQQFHFGYSVGINKIGFTIIPHEGFKVTLKENPGININLITKYRLGKNLDLRFLPGIQFAQRDLTIKNLNTGDSTGWKIESVYVDLPVLLKYRADRVNNFAPYLIAGVCPRFDLTGGEIQSWRDVSRLVKVFDFYPELGVGVDFYLQEVKISTELKFSVGMLNVFKDPGAIPEYTLYAQGVEKILSRMVILSIHIE
jgi:hypothetical protein